MAPFASLLLALVTGAPLTPAARWTLAVACLRLARAVGPNAPALLADLVPVPPDPPAPPPNAEPGGPPSGDPPGRRLAHGAG